MRTNAVSFYSIVNEWDGYVRFYIITFCKCIPFTVYCSLKTVTKIER